MADKNELSSAKHRLANSRQAIVRYMGHEDAPEESAVHDGSAGISPGTAQIDTSAGTWALTRQVATAWWRGHPAHLAIDVATPMVQSYAEKQPLKLLGISAGIGAVIVVLRPWRLISLTGLLIAALKSSELSSVAKSFMPSSRQHDGYP
jgi:hypothetical protein